MTDYKHLKKRAELRWWWFNFDLRHHRSALRELLCGLLVFGIGVLVFFGLAMLTVDAMGGM